MTRTLIVVAVLAVLAVAFFVYQARVANPRVEAELRIHPDGQRAAKVMLISLPDGRRIPVNYLREGKVIYAGADGRWWRVLRGAGAPVELLVRGQTLKGHAQAIENDPVHTRNVFARLRPTVPKWLPDVLNGVLVEITLDPAQRH